ncbi:hypothetical protein TPY_2657 [Sulfobacillus acidophilus TPY]|uniref:ATPase involved in chromosome partitioning n=1 Tax=Sulfobacillus acidophilus (strain ATCC 700253 / DSM 10332 / NAL) TaxID=679936 RepID=G8TV83_SULAD|nr:hypothetical protein TPY_2657 [Sulfobacillus acidophilus TPY]AEW04723.1 ATPase involved in chromosome partitioning [Sulfobacillus acidophilus DSM 10332]
MSAILGYALGPIDPPLYQQITETFPAQYLSDWGIREAGATTDAVVANGLQTDVQPWTTLLVTPYLTGQISLSEALTLLKDRWPMLRIAVLAGEDHEALRPFIAKLAAYQIYNILVADNFTFNDLTSLVTTDWPWERIKPFLTVSPADDPPQLTTLPPRIHDHHQPYQASQAIALISGKGGVGKTGLVANLAWASAPWGGFAIDADLTKPSLAWYFRDPGTAWSPDLRELVGRIPELQEWHDSDMEWRVTPRHKQLIRDFLTQCPTITNGVQVMVGWSRTQPVLSMLPPALIAEMIRQAKLLKPIVWVDLPADVYQPFWVDVLRAVDKIVLVTSPDAMTVYETMDVLKKLDVLQIPRSLVTVWVNFGGRGELTPTDIVRRYLHVPLAGTTAYDAKMWHTALTRHQLPAQQHPKIWQNAVRQLTGWDPPRQTVGRQSFWPKIKLFSTPRGVK